MLIEQNWLIQNSFHYLQLINTFPIHSIQNIIINPTRKNTFFKLFCPMNIKTHKCWSSPYSTAVLILKVMCIFCTGRQGFDQNQQELEIEEILRLFIFYIKLKAFPKAECFRSAGICLNSFLDLKVILETKALVESVLPMKYSVLLSILSNNSNFKKLFSSFFFNVIRSRISYYLNFLSAPSLTSQTQLLCLQPALRCCMRTQSTDGKIRMAFPKGKTSARQKDLDNWNERNYKNKTKENTKAQCLKSRSSKESPTKATKNERGFSKNCIFQWSSHAVTWQ